MHGASPGLADDGRGVPCRKELRLDLRFLDVCGSRARDDRLLYDDVAILGKNLYDYIPLRRITKREQTSCAICGGRKKRVLDSICVDSIVGQPVGVCNIHAGDKGLSYVCRKETILGRKSVLSRS